MKTDKERIHRWLTQADLERMLDDAYQRGAAAMRRVAADRVYEVYRGCLPPEQWATVTDLKVLAEEIDVHLPVPEDK